MESILPSSVLPEKDDAAMWAEAIAYAKVLIKKENAAHWKRTYRLRKSIKFFEECIKKGETWPRNKLNAAIRVQDNHPMEPTSKSTLTEPDSKRRPMKGEK